MAAIRDQRDIRLRFGVGDTTFPTSLDSPPTTGLNSSFSRTTGLPFDALPADPPSIPIGSTVHFDVERPTSIVGGDGPFAGEVSDGGVTQGFIFEHAPVGPVFNAGAQSFQTRNRVLVANGSSLIPSQVEPAWAAFSPSVVGALVQKGKAEGIIVMPGAPSFTPNLSGYTPHFLRVRWSGPSVASGEAMAVPSGGPPTVIQGTLAHGNIAPGSIVITCVIGTQTITIRDNGRGRLVGVTPGAPWSSADGYINYLTGDYILTFYTVAPTATPSASYEYGCLYKPLDVHLEWDALMAQ